MSAFRLHPSTFPEGGQFFPWKSPLQSATLIVKITLPNTLFLTFFVFRLCKWLENIMIIASAIVEKSRFVPQQILAQFERI